MGKNQSRWNSEKQPSITMAWNKHLSELMKFKQQWGHCDVPSQFDECPKLGRWATHQRSQYRLLKSGKKSSISDERVAQLEKLGFKWNSDIQLAFTMAWNERLSYLLEFKQQWGHCNVPQKYAHNLKLGGWVKYQRSHEWQEVLNRDERVAQ